MTNKSYAECIAEVTAMHVELIKTSPISIEAMLILDIIQIVTPVPASHGWPAKWMDASSSFRRGNTPINPAWVELVAQWIEEGLASLPEVKDALADAKPYVKVGPEISLLHELQQMAGWPSVPIEDGYHAAGTPQFGMLERITGARSQCDPTFHGSHQTILCDNQWWLLATTPLTHKLRAITEALSLECFEWLTDVEITPNIFKSSTRWTHSEELKGFSVKSR